MERFFEVTNSNLGKEYIEYETNHNLVNEAFKEFSKNYGIETEQYAPSTSSLMIVPTENDKIKFQSSLCKREKEHGIVAFKSNSKINKAWVDKVKDIKLINKHMITFGKFCILGKYSTRLFDIEGIVYFSVNGEDYYVKNLKMYEGMNEMKASEFFKIIEDYEEKER